MSTVAFRKSIPRRLNKLIAWLICSGSILNGQSPPPENVSASQQHPSLRKFTFKHVNAADDFTILAQLSGDDNPYGIAVDERTDSLVSKSDEEKTRKLEASCTLLDAVTPVTPDTRTSLSVSITALGQQPLVTDFFH